MNGAESLVRTLVKGGVEVCFADPGTSEMHFVGALDRVEGMRCILGLFEGVCSGAADGYYRMEDKPASTLLISGRASPMPPPTCTTPRRPAPASSTSWASTRSITSSTTRRLPPTSRASPGRSRIG